MSSTTVFIQYYTGGLSQSNKKNKLIVTIRKEKTDLLLLADYITEKKSKKYTDTSKTNNQV